MAKSETHDHVETIKSLLLTVKASDRMHALIVEGPAGWGKTTAVDDALKGAGISGVHLGAYSTPLHLFNFLCENSKRFVVIDDCAGLFNDQNSMAILKAATWAPSNHRKVRWGSTSSKAVVEEFMFEGNLVIVCNTFPISADAEAVRSRSFPYRIEVGLSRAKELLEEAASEKKWYPDTRKARDVARFLCTKLTSGSVDQMSYRTLQMGYELAQHNSKQWRELLDQMIVTAPENPKQLIRKLAKQDLKVKDQARLFEESTGLKRRTFFKYRRALNMSKD